MAHGVKFGRKPWGRHQLAQLRAICPSVADLLAIDALGASGLQCLKLAGEVLIGGRNPRISDNSHLMN